MRPVKFRAWRRSEKKMYDLCTSRYMVRFIPNCTFHNGLPGFEVFEVMHGSLIGLKGVGAKEIDFDKRAITDEAIRFLFDSSDAGLIEFTGILDRNGKEIFENDRLRWDGNTYEVRYLNGEWILWHSEDIGGDRPSLVSIIKPSGLNVEVIGNVWENPELVNP